MKMQFYCAFLQWVRMHTLLIGFTNFLFALLICILYNYMPLNFLDGKIYNKPPAKIICF